MIFQKNPILVALLVHRVAKCQIFYTEQMEAIIRKSKICFGNYLIKWCFLPPFMMSLSYIFLLLLCESPGLFLGP